MARNAIALGVFVLLEAAWAQDRGRTFRGWRALSAFVLLQWYDSNRLEDRLSELASQGILRESAEAVEALRSLGVASLEASNEREEVSRARERRMVKLTSDLLRLTKLLLIVGALTLAAAIAALLLAD